MQEKNNQSSERRLGVKRLQYSERKILLGLRGLLMAWFLRRLLRRRFLFLMLSRKTLKEIGIALKPYLSRWRTV